jgi:hypothetical protein
MLSSSASAAAADDSDNAQCGIYLAVSSTSTVDDATWGLYAGKEISKDTTVGYPDVAMNTFHLKANVGFGANNRMKASEIDFLNRAVDFLEGFIWVPDAAGARFELAEGRTVTAIPGGGVLGGFNPKLTNAVWNHSSAYFRPALGEEPASSHPGRGSISPFFNVGLKSTEEIVAGSEIFLDYGENWAEEDKKEELSKEDHQKVDETILKMVQFFEKHENELDAHSKSQIYSFLGTDVMNAALGVSKARKVSAILPTTPDGLKKVMEDGGSLAHSQPTVYRKIEWLQEFGRCMDNIRPGASTIKNAGRGAFATRKIAKGGLVAPVPLIQIPDKAVLDMHNVIPSGDKGEYIRESNDVIGQQIMLNYCYGHPQSKMVFFPAGSIATLINHGKKPNAKMVWSTHQNHNKLWLKMNPRKLVDEENAYIGLMMEIVALRDIGPDEEILIDYGAEWSSAWDAHVVDWNKKIKAGEIPKEWPLRALDMNEVYRTKTYNTAKELEKDPYPENVMLKGFLMVQESANAGTEEDPKIWGEPPARTAYESDNLFDMMVTDRVEVKDDDSLIMPYNYTVKWTNVHGESTYVKEVPHQALVFVDAPTTGDQFVENAFRHYIGIPDDIFPTGAWRNQK